MDLTWYNSLHKPFFNPPSWIFAPIWIVLYILMLVSVFLIYKQSFKKKKVKSSLNLFGIQLVLNLSWSPIFFGIHQIFIALIVIIFMWFFIYKTIKAFYGIDKRAAYLLYPYIVWVSIAGILNLSIWLLNK